MFWVGTFQWHLFLCSYLTHSHIIPLAVSISLFTLTDPDLQIFFLFWYHCFLLTLSSSFYFRLCHLFILFICVLFAFYFFWFDFFIFVCLFPIPSLPLSVPISQHSVQRPKLCTAVWLKMQQMNLLEWHQRTTILFACCALSQLSVLEFVATNTRYVNDINFPFFCVKTSFVIHWLIFLNQFRLPCCTWRAMRGHQVIPWEEFVPFKKQEFHLPCLLLEGN